MRLMRLLRIFSTFDWPRAVVTQENDNRMRRVRTVIQTTKWLWQRHLIFLQIKMFCGTCVGQNAISSLHEKNHPLAFSRPHQVLRIRSGHFRMESQYRYLPLVLINPAHLSLSNSTLSRSTGHPPPTPGPWAFIQFGSLQAHSLYKADHQRGL